MRDRLPKTKNLSQTPNAIYKREWHKKNPGKAMEYYTRWANKNPEKARAVNNKSVKKYRDSNPDAHKATVFKSVLKRSCAQVGISVEQFHQLSAAQDGKCFLCNNPPSGPRLLLDHNHDTGKFRALLCTNCNTGLGMFRDNPELLRRAAEYLESTSK